MTDVVSLSQYETDYNVEMLQTEIFGAIFACYEFRKNDVGLTKAEMARRGGWKDRSLATRYMSGPQNFTIETISRLCTALGADFKFVLIDRADRSRCFNAGGISVDLRYAQGGTIQPSAIEQHGWMVDGQHDFPSIQSRSANRPLARSEEDKQLAMIKDQNQATQEWK